MPALTAREAGVLDANDNVCGRRVRRVDLDAQAWPVDLERHPEASPIDEEVGEFQQKSLLERGRRAAHDRHPHAHVIDHASAHAIEQKIPPWAYTAKPPRWT